MGLKNLNVDVPYSPWLLFLVLFPSISLISYFDFGLEAKLWIFLMGITIPLAWGFYSRCRKVPPEESTVSHPPWESEFLPSIAPALVILFALLLAFTRFYKLSQVPFWLLGDDGTVAFYAIKLSKKWENRLLFGDAQLEPFQLWALALFFKAFHVSRESLAFYSGLVSLGAIPVGYWAARQYFSRSFSFLAVGLLGFNFWVLVCSRHAYMVWILLWQFLALALLGLCLKNRWERPWQAWSLLGIVLGIGFYIYTPWPMMAVAVWAAFFFRKDSNNPERVKFLFWTGLILLAVAFPMIQARFSSHGMTYIRALFDGREAYQYLIGIFFYGFGSAPYGPCWGGMLDSFMGALFWVGAVEGVRWRSNPILRWLVLAGILFFLPGALTTHLEMQRITLLYPLLIVVSVLGAQALLTGLKGGKKIRAAAAGAFLVFPALLDGYHYWGSYQDGAVYASNKNHWRYIEYSRAFHLLSAEAGLGKRFWVLDHFFNGYNDHTFELAVYPLDAANQPDGSFPTPQETAVLANHNYQPFLEKRFPGSRWIWLVPDLPDENGGMMLGLIPNNPNNRPVLESWRKADRTFADIEDGYMYRYPDQSIEGIVEGLIGTENQCKGDPFLLSQWGEKIGFYALWYPSVILEPVVEAAKKSLEGYPAAHLYNQLGLLLVRRGNGGEARRAFLSALRAPVNQTDAAANLELLDKLVPAGSPGGRGGDNPAR